MIVWGKRLVLLACALGIGACSRAPLPLHAPVDGSAVDGSTPISTASCQHVTTQSIYVPLFGNQPLATTAQYTAPPFGPSNQDFPIPTAIHAMHCKGAFVGDAFTAKNEGPTDLTFEAEESAFGSGLFTTRVRSAVPRALDVTTCMWMQGEGQLEASSVAYSNHLLLGNDFMVDGTSVRPPVDLDFTGDGDRNRLTVDPDKPAYALSCTFDIRGK